MDAQAPSAPAAEPVKVEVVGAPDPKRDAGWWFTTIGPVVVAALALVVAIISLVDQHGSTQIMLATQARTYASEVSFSAATTGHFQYEIDNYANAEITSVLILPAAHARLDSLGTIRGCTGITVTLSSPNAPILYFTDANGAGWELGLNGPAQQFTDPGAIRTLLPLSAVPLPPPVATIPQPLHGC